MTYTPFSLTCKHENKVSFILSGDVELEVEIDSIKFSCGCFIEPAKEPQHYTLDINRLGRAIHNLRWCKASDIFHDLAHSYKSVDDSDEWNVLTWEANYKKYLKEAYEKADEEEKTLYGGNA